jgi:uncharacterized protein (TIGR03437 family)
VEIRFGRFCDCALTCVVLLGSKLAAAATPLVYSRVFPYPATPLAIAVDSTGSSYVAGNTANAGLPATPGVVQASYGGGMCPGGTSFGQPVTIPCEDIFIAKLDAAGGIQWLTYLGGTGNEKLGGIAVDSTGNVVVAGTTTSLDFPVTAQALQGHRSGSSNAFAAKLDAHGAHLLYSTYIGGSGSETATGLALDSAGNAYVAGYTVSHDFPVSVDALLISPSPGFVFKLDPSGAALVYSTYFYEAIAAIAVDAPGFTYLAGGAVTTFPVPAGAFQQAPRSRNNAFMAKLSLDGTAMVYGTYLGGSGIENVKSIAIDKSGSAYVTGFTTSKDFPTTPGSFAPRQSNSFTSFVTKLDPDGSQAVYSTYMTGNINQIAVDGAGAAYLGGYAAGNTFPSTPGAIHPCNSASLDVVVAELNPQGTDLSYGTYLGGTGADEGFAIAVNGAGTMFIAGTTDSLNFPTSDASGLQSTIGGFPIPGFFLAALNDVPGPLLNYNCIVNAASFSRTPIAPGELITIFGPGVGPVSGVGAVLDSQSGLATAIAGVRVLFDGVPAPLLYVQRNQINLVVPYAVSGDTTTIALEDHGALTNAVDFPVALASPAIFPVAGFYQLTYAIRNQDGTQNWQLNPATVGSTVSIYGTGVGQLDPPGADGKIASAPLGKPVLPLSVSINGVDAEVLYAGEAPGLVSGVVQINVRVPDFPGGFPGLSEVVLRVGDVSGPAGTIYLRPSR